MNEIEISSMWTNKCRDKLGNVGTAVALNKGTEMTTRNPD
jgi:hypothetical protein